MARWCFAFVVSLAPWLHGQSPQIPAKEIRRTAAIARLLKPFVDGNHIRLSIQMALVGRFQDQVLKVKLDGWGQKDKDDLYEHYLTVWREWANRESEATGRSDPDERAQALDSKHGKIRERLGQLSLDGIVTHAKEELDAEHFAETLKTAERKLEAMNFRGPGDDRQRRVLRGFLDRIRDCVSAWKSDRNWTDVRSDLAALDGLLARIAEGKKPLGKPLEDYLRRTIDAAVNQESDDGRLEAYALVNPLYAALLEADHLVENAIRLRESQLMERMTWIDTRFTREDCTLRFIKRDDGERERGDEFLVEDGRCTAVRFSKLGNGKKVVEIPRLGDAKFVFLVPKDRVSICFKLGGSSRPKGSADRIWVESVNNKWAGKIDLKLPRRGVAGFEFFQTAFRDCWVSRKPVTRDRIRQGYVAMYESSAEPRRVKEQFAALWRASKPRREKESDPDKVAKLEDPAWMNKPFLIDASTRAAQSAFISGLFSVGHTSILNAAPQFRGERLPDRSLARDLSKLPFLAEHGLVDETLGWVPDEVKASIEPGRRGRPIYTVLLMH